MVPNAKRLPSSLPSLLLSLPTLKSRLKGDEEEEEEEEEVVEKIQMLSSFW